MYEPGHTPADPEPALDPNRLAGVLGDEPDAIREILVMAIDSLRALVTSLRSALESGDLAAAKAGAHEIKGVSANVGAQALANAASALESVLSRGVKDPAAELVAPVADAYDRFAAAAQALVDRPS